MISDLTDSFIYQINRTSYYIGTELLSTNSRPNSKHAFQSFYSWIHRGVNRPFFINYILERRKTRKEKLLEHYNKFKEDVLSHWNKQKSVLEKQIDSSDSVLSLIPLYVNIIEYLREPIYFNRFRSHLKDEKYKEIENIILDIEKSESVHNKKVTDLMNNIRPNIRNTICSAKNSIGITGSKIDMLREYNKNDPNYSPHFVLDEIINYCIDKANGKAATMKVRKLNSTFQLVREGDFMSSAGMGDEQTMNWLLNKIESLTIDKELRDLQTEGNRINDLYNKELKSKIKDLSVQIDDGYLAGKCDMKYCASKFS